MKLKNIIYGMMCVVTLGSCSDKMECFPPNWHVGV